MSLIVYADFNCPYSFLASRRVDALQAAGLDVDWRAVEHDPSIAFTGIRLDDAGRADVERELEQVRALLIPGEEYPAQACGVMPSTRAAVVAYAEAVGAGVADDVRRLLYDAYWLEGRDIGSPEVLRPMLAPAILRGHSDSFPLQNSGYAVSVSRGPITYGAHLRIRAWHDEWDVLGTSTVPTIVHDGETVPGVDGLARLAGLLQRNQPAAA